MRTSHVVIALLLTVACGGEIRLASETTRAELGEGWTPLRTGDRTSCAFGSDYRFFARSGASDRLLVFLHGGGACWSAETCAAGANATYPWEVDRRQNPGRQFGIFDLGHPENPVSGYSMVVAPTCTGDVHLGNRDASYTPTGTVDSDARESDAFTVRHRGQANVEAVLEWLYANFEGPVQVLVIGSSAGGVAAPFYADRIARRYPRARVVGLGDAGGGFRSDSIRELDVARWGLPEALRQHAGWKDFPDSELGVELITATAAGGTPNLELYQVDQAYDQEQRAFLELLGSPDVELLAVIRRNRSDIRELADSFRSFTVGGYEHTVMNRSHFYYYATEDQRFRDWFAAIVSGDSVPDVECRECDRPQLLYTEADLQMVDRALELLATADRWDPEDEVERCSAEATRWSLRCAVFTALRDTREMSPPPDGAYPAFYDLRFTAADRLGEDRLQRPMIRLNNREGTSFEEIRGVLREVRDRIRRQLEREG